MSIFLDEHSRIIVQGMTGSEGTKHTRRMLASGATVVGGVNARSASMCVVPMIGSPPMPTAVEKPMSRSSYMSW